MQNELSATTLQPAEFRTDDGLPDLYSRRLEPRFFLSLSCLLLGDPVSPEAKQAAPRCKMFSPTLPNPEASPLLSPKRRTTFRHRKTILLYYIEPPYPLKTSRGKATGTAHKVRPACTYMVFFALGMTSYI